ncbi:MAG: hypothetical protein FD143_235 [Ignavibacteria bacterium]|nr:MAG: hypothetical protein FD143_235 [Ignavibacteria bacterium]KAF0162076.1 MAG: hypothetical protein FD188_325 [Ignavibacteria bacterium]
MKNNNLFHKFNLFLVVSSFIIWLGTYIARHLAIYQLFEPDGLVLRSVFNQENLSTVWITILPLFVTTLISFPLFILLFIVYLFISKRNLRNEGWLFISFLIITVTAPFEFFLMVKDYHIVTLILSNAADPMNILYLVRERITILSSFPLIEIFSYLAIVFLTIFKPLSKN